jgi:hypothetical protein
LGVTDYEQTSNRKLDAFATQGADLSTREMQPNDGVFHGAVEKTVSAHKDVLGGNALGIHVNRKTGKREGLGTQPQNSEQS